MYSHYFGRVCIRTRDYTYVHHIKHPILTELESPVGGWYEPFKHIRTYKQEGKIKRQALIKKNFLSPFNNAKENI